MGLPASHPDNACFARGSSLCERYMSCRKVFNILAPNCVTRDRQPFILIALPSLSLAGPTGPLQVFACLLFGESGTATQAPAGSSVWSAVSGASRRGGQAWHCGRFEMTLTSSSLPAALLSMKHHASRQLPCFSQQSSRRELLLLLPRYRAGN